MEKICNFDIVVNTCLADIDTNSPTSEFHKNDFLLSVINGFEDGKWRESEFRQFIMDNITQTGLSAKERADLYAEPYKALTASVKKLRLVDLDKGMGSEIAEIILYGVMKHHYRALSVIPKIFYKQNPKDNAKGADSVHIVLENNDFTLWLGEAKFYNDISDFRLYEPINSVFNTIDTERIKKENSIITNLRDLEYTINDSSMRQKVLDALHQNTSIDEIRKRLHVPILLLHECDKTQKATELTEAYRCEIKEFHLERARHYFKTQNKKQVNKNIHGYEHIKFHLILFPVPNKTNIVNWFVSRAKQLKEDA